MSAATGSAFVIGGYLLLAGAALTLTLAARVAGTATWTPTRYLA